MCKKTNYHGTSNTQIDKCMRGLIKSLNIALKKDYKILACCCGHGKYPMTIITRFQNRYMEKIFDLISGKVLKRRRKFYNKDKQGYYYIPETLMKKS